MSVIFSQPLRGSIFETVLLRNWRSVVVPAARHSTLGYRGFPVIAARLWNSLPDDIVTATSLATFRRKLKTFLFRRSYNNVGT